MPTEKELPRYTSHKTVHALKIQDVHEYEDGGGLITPSLNAYASFQVDKDYMEKHQPQVGGYYVVYKDGYTSWSPAIAFEDGYTLEG